MSVHPAGSPPRAVLLMAASAGLFACMAVSIRLAASELHAFEIAFFRNLFGLLFALPLLRRAGTGLLKTSRFGLYTVRCLIGMCAMLSGFWALVHLPLAQAVALSYTTPLFVTILAVLVLGEVVRARRWTAVGFGFVGALVILRPGIMPISFDAMVALAAAAFGASAAISIKVLSRTERPEAIVLWMVLIMTPMSLLPALWVWQWPSATDWIWLAATGFFGTTAHICLTRAYKLGEISALTPLNFLQLPLVAAMAWPLFGEIMDLWTAIGAGIIFVAVAYIARREAQVARRQLTDPAIASDAVTPVSSSQLPRG